MEELLKAGYTQVVDVDIKGYFDTISHERLMERVQERIADGRGNGDPRRVPQTRGNRTLKGWYGYFKDVHPNVMKETEQWIRMRLRTILRGRAGRRGRSRKRDNIEWGSHYFNEHGLFSLFAARELEIANLRKGANY